MRRLTATEAARRFSDLLDRVERDGETFLVERRGRVIASVSPAAGVTGREIKDILRGRPPDSGWAAELARLRQELELEERPWSA
jgi:antitoxin (DNA-binding transcriptional repressor) of toxin-antitoxin stability system